jgi:diadenosine tetraphosphate (Ap4A) HIT family hydrolase
LSGWPPDWPARFNGDACSMCDGGRPDEDAYGVRILPGSYSDAYLQRAALQRGYTIVIWRGRHVAESTDLEPEEASGYWLEVLEVARATSTLSEIPGQELRSDAGALRAIVAFTSREP